MNKQQIQLYTSEDDQVQLEIQFEQEALWLTQAQIADLSAKHHHAPSQRLRRRRVGRSGNL